MKQIVVTNRITARNTESFNLYLKDIYHHEILTPTEEKELTIRVINGDEAAKDELIKRNLRFVVTVAKQYANSINLLEDLVNEGNIGLIIATQKFKPEMGYKFISYAVWWVQKIICEHLDKHGRTVRLPANKINSLSKLDKKVCALEQKLGRSVDIQEIIDEYDSEFEAKDFETLEVLRGTSIDSLDREIGSEDGHSTLSDMISDTSVQSTDHLLIDSDLKSEISRIINTLKPRDRQIMVSLYGLEGEPIMSLIEVGDAHNLSREMVRQIRIKCLHSLKKHINIEQLAD